MEGIIASSPTRAKTRPNRALHVTVDPVMVPAHRFVCPYSGQRGWGRGWGLECGMSWHSFINTVIYSVLGQGTYVTTFCIK